MWTRELLKTNAKTVLKRNYWRPFFACLIVTLLTGTGAVENRVEVQLEQLEYELENLNISSLLAILLSVTALVISLVAIAWSIFGVNVLVVGHKRFMMENRLGDSPIGTLFSAFSGPSYWNVVKAMLWMNVKIFLYHLLLIIPGIIKSYEYYYVPYLLAENPNMTPERAMQLSSRMTDGEKMEIFVLELSFIGWDFLGMLALGLGGYFVTPYKQATYAELYAAAKAKAFYLGLSNEAELSGFVQH